MIKDAILLFFTNNLKIDMLKNNLHSTKAWLVSSKSVKI